MQTRRLIGSNSFYLIPGSENPADLVTRGECNVDDVGPGSVWQDGPAWMYSNLEEMPLRSYEKVCSDLTPQDVDTVEHEVHPSIPGVHYTYDGVLDEESQTFWKVFKLFGLKIEDPTGRIFKQIGQAFED